MDIHGCRGCWQGGKDLDHPCVQRDDMEQIYLVYREADVVVLVGHVTQSVDIQGHPALEEARKLGASI